MPVVDPQLIIAGSPRQGAVVAAAVLQELDHIGHAWHQPLYRELAILRDAAGLISRGLPGGGGLRGLAERVDALQYAVADHMMREDQQLFPWLRAGRLADLRAPVLGLRMEHQDFAEQLDRLAADLVAAEDQLARHPDCQALLAASYRLDSQLRRHMDCEERLVFARVLDEEPQDSLWPE